MLILDYNHPAPIQIGQPVFVPLYAGVRAGFPSPADDFLLKRIDLSDALIKHPEATFLMRIKGHSMAMAGIDDGDIVVVDKAITPEHGKIVIACVDGEFTCKRLFMQDGITKLQPANPEYPDLVFKDEQTLEVWGVVTSCIKQY
ncbi:translesion error-prone DNA polymerase V autoproteolytic subunit [Nitrosomonas sp.]|uniref:LexA family protein n=1 Tax=Nitrosomonas sp. TaxID=42353 RepID=UPI0026235E9C|nr:translesion error-prone DNA polymerase V autoproteolytic subunit [Nitrosomonas sp.]MCW5600434.1 translesion error-prone DNA polymerase V autoproteolytic subunit [Nitrosomonas sp.]